MMSSPPLSKLNARRGFTLIEVMIVVAIIAILAAIAIPSYRDYIIRGRLTDATNGLAATRANMERHFQDNRTYVTVGAFISPCAAAAPIASRTFGEFVVTCSAGPTATTYTLSADGNGSMAGFGFTVTQDDTRTTTTTATGWGPTGANTCWVVRKGQTC